MGISGNEISDHFATNICQFAIPSLYKIPFSNFTPASRCMHNVCNIKNKRIYLSHLRPIIFLYVLPLSIVPGFII